MNEVRRAAFAATLTVFALTGCSTLDALNPFSNSGPKMAELQPITTSLDARMAWREKVGKAGGYAFTPAIVGSSVFAAGASGEIVRIDDGRVAWRVNAGQALSGGVGADDHLVVVGSPKGDVLAFSAKDGSPLWKAKASSEVLAPPAVHDGIVIVRSGDNRLAAYDATNGTRKWVFMRQVPALSLRTIARPLIDGKYVFAGFPGGKLVAVNLENGASAWEGTVALPKGATELDRVSDITSVPVIAGRTICAVAFQGRVSCFDLNNGSLIWGRDMSSAAGLAIDGRALYVTDDKGAVHALDMASGASLWKQDKLFLRRVTSPVARNRFVAVADAEGVVHFLSREDGSFIARVATDGDAVVAPPQLLGARVLVQTSGGSVSAIGAE